MAPGQVYRTITGCFLLFFLLAPVAPVTTQTFCEDDWLRFEDFNGDGLCVKIFNEPATWDMAKETCQDNMAALGNLDRLLEFSFTDKSQKLSVSISGELFKNNISNFWSGMHVNKNRLMWDDFGPRFVSRSKYDFNRLAWRWEPSQPDTDNGDCGKATVLSIEGVPSEDVSVALHDCQTRLSYYCQKSPTDFFMQKQEFCPSDFYGNEFLPHCYKIGPDKRSFADAETKCKLYNGGNMLFGNTNFNTKLIERLMATVFRETNRTEDMVVWSEQLTEVCVAVRYTLESEVPFGYPRLDCVTSQEYVCAVPVNAPEKVSIEANSVLFSQEDLLNYPRFQPLPLTVSLNRKRHPNEVMFIQTPTEILNSTQQFFQWEFKRSSLAWNIQQYTGPDGSYRVNITLPDEQIPLRKRSADDGQQDIGYIRARQKRQLEIPGIIGNEDIVGFIDYEYVRRSTGYYQFGIYTFPQQKFVASEKYFVRYSEKDLYIYVAYVNLRPGVIGSSNQEAFLTREDIMSYGLLQDESYMDNFGEFTSSILNSRPESLEQSLHYYRGQVESIDLSTNRTKLRYFVNPVNSRQRPDEYEGTVRQTIADYLPQMLIRDVFDISSLRVVSTVNCPFLKTVHSGRNLTFFPVSVGSYGYSWERCYPGRSALATAKCVGGYENGVQWSNINVDTGCGQVPTLNQSASTDTLKNISQTTITQDNYLNVINDTVLLTDPDVNLTEADVIYTADILYNYLAFSPSNSEQILDDLYDIVDNVLYAKKEYLDSAQKITNAANRIIQSMDTLTNEVLLLPNQPVVVVKEFVACVILEQLGVGDTTIGIKLDNTANTTLMQNNIKNVRTPSDVPLPNTDTAIYLSKKLAEGAQTRLSFQLYSKTELFSVISSKFKINSKIAAARLTRGDKNIEDLGDEVVTTVFSILEYDENMVCAYWNYSASENAGGWEKKGCSMDYMDDGRVVCKCNHLTNFAVLIDLEAGSISDTDKLVLGIITKVGLIISIICLGITVVTFLLFKHLRKGRGQQVLVNLSVAMLCSAILFLVGIDRTETRTGCIIIAALLHYFILVTFMWMLVEGVLQYLRFVKVLGTYIPNFMKKSMIPAWGLPLIPIIVIMAIDYNMYFGGNGYCWLSWDPFLYGFLIPVAVIIFVNLIVFIMVMVNLCCRRKHKGMASNQSDRKMAMLHLQAGISILVILGLTWLFGFLTVDSTRIAFHYLFAIFNAFQGCFIFLLFTFRETQIRKAWRRLCCKDAKYKSGTSNSDSGPKKHASSSDTKSTGYSSKSSSTVTNSKSNHQSENDGLIFNNPQYGP